MGRRGGVRKASRLLGALGLALVLGLAAVACSGDDDDDDAGANGDESDASAETTTTEDPGPATDPYDGHTSEIYDGTTNWLCHPDLADDECRDLSATELAADGTTRPSDLAVAEDPAIDCFYVYPTVSQDPSVNSDLTPGDFERQTVRSQAAPFASTCRVFAPVYRQVTLAGLGGVADEDARTMAYEDAVDAWKTYISQYNDGRGVVLVGHSQGTFVLRELIAAEIDGNEDLRSRLVSAILLGGTVIVPDGEDVGGSFENIPACGEIDQVGCVISYASYPTDSPPPETGFFGRAEDTGDRALCVDPVELTDGDGLAESVVPLETGLMGEVRQSMPEITTRYVVLPDFVEAGCVREGEFDYLTAGQSSPDDPRPVEGLVIGNLTPDWGLHIQDASLAMGDLLTIVAAEAEAFTGGGS